MNIENLKAKDPFNDPLGLAVDAISSGTAIDQIGDDDANMIHIRLQQRNGRKCLTTIQGLSNDIDLKKLKATFQKRFATNGTIVTDKEHGEVIQLQGDHRTSIVKFLVDEEIAKKSNIKVHGT